jgi:hypothetical protein
MAGLGAIFQFTRDEVASRDEHEKIWDRDRAMSGGINLQDILFQVRNCLKLMVAHIGYWHAALVCRRLCSRPWVNLRFRVPSFLHACRNTCTDWLWFIFLYIVVLDLEYIVKSEVA